ncbi:MAG: O-antigen ligase family protein [Archangium sp.]
MRFVALIVFAVGVQVHELFGTIGLALLALTFVPALPQLTLARLKAWWPLLAFIVWSLLAPTLGGNPPDGTGVARTLDWVIIPLVAVAVSELTEARRRTLVIAIAATLMLSCFIAGLQHFGFWPAESAFAGLEWTRIPFSRVYERIGDEGTRFMGGGLLFHRLKFAHVSGLMLVVLLATRKPAMIAVAVLALISVWIFPYARMGAVAAMAGIAVTVALTASSPRKALLVIGGLGVFAVAAVLLVAPLRQRFVAGLTDTGSGQRTQHLGAGLEAIRQHPIAGVGPGQFRPSKFGGPEMAEHVKDNPGKAHNQFVSMAAETGVIGGLGFIALLIWLGAKARSQPLGVLTLGALAQFVVLSLVHDPLFQAPYSMSLVLLLGAGLSSAPRSPDAEGADGASAPASPATPASPPAPR